MPTASVPMFSSVKQLITMAMSSAMREITGVDTHSS